MTAARKLNKASPQRIECHEVQDAARTLAASNQALDRSRHYYVWVDGRAYPFAPLVRAACKAAGQPEPKFDAVPTGGNSPWHRRLRALHFPVLPKGFEPVSPSNDGAGGRMPPAAVLDRRAVEAAAAQIDRAPHFLARRTGGLYDLVLDGGRRYPIKAFCIAVLHELGYGWREDWTDIGQNKAWDQRLQDLGVTIVTKRAPPEQSPVADWPYPTRSDPVPHAEPSDLTPEAVRAAARAWSQQDTAYQAPHASTVHDLLIGEDRYPPQAILELAVRHLDLAPPASWGRSTRQSPWYQRLDALGFPMIPKPTPEECELEAFLERDDVPTEIWREGVFRLTQGAFRRSLVEARGEQCDVTGIAVGAVLRASHIQRWADSDEEPRARRDPANGLLLAAHLDALFEHGLIAFADDGSMLISPELDEQELERLGVERGMRLRFVPNERQQVYLNKHRERTEDKRSSL
ncbi:HNH endonuclease [Cupriavidus basilensis]|uniref:HNH endonuclease n=1 Tax=Cupriavidus basilensis TaxID=68895 RepID=UPI0023E8821C|nr:HNH endonuclease [Cupriavidus basilensis]MDF3883941.1 HNH endonuclease [Cupriavidus basilensis]